MSMTKQMIEDYQDKRYTTNMRRTYGSNWREIVENMNKSIVEQETTATNKVAIIETSTTFNGFKF